MHSIFTKRRVTLLHSSVLDSGSHVMNPARVGVGAERLRGPYDERRKSEGEGISTSDYSDAV